MMKGLNFEYKNFFKQDLSNWFLVGANLYFADLRWANLSEANLYGADLRWASLSEANLRGANLGGATYNKQTIFPDGFDPIAAGMKKVDTEFLLW